jgi:hypothetical protein
MGPKPCHGADVTSTTAGILLHMTANVREVYTHLDSTNPLRFLIGTECSPFSPYCWIYTLAQAYCRPKNDQSDRKDCGDEHRWATRYAKGDIPVHLLSQLDQMVA